MRYGIGFKLVLATSRGDGNRGLLLIRQWPCHLCWRPRNVNCLTATHVLGRDFQANIDAVARDTLPAGKEPRQARPWSVALRASQRAVSQRG